MIKIKSLHKSFGSLEVLKGITKEISKGERIYCRKWRKNNRVRGYGYFYSF